jgi:hypothetical protein
MRQMQIIPTKSKYTKSKENYETECNLRKEDKVLQEQQIRQQERNKLN